MHARVGSPRHGEADVVSHDPRQDLGKGALDRPHVGVALPRPAAELRTVVRQRETDHSHRRWLREPGEAISSRVRRARSWPSPRRPRPRPQLEDPRVAALSLGEPWPDLVEQARHDVAVRDVLQHLASSGQVAALRERDELLRVRSEHLRLGLGRVDRLVHEQLLGAIPLTYEQFRYAFASAVTEDEAHELYATYAVPAAGAPLFQAATANLNPWTQVKVKTKNPDRGPLLIISGERDHTVPWAIASALYKRQKRNPGVTEIQEIADRGHSLTIDHGSQEVAQTSLDFVARFVQP